MLHSLLDPIRISSRMIIQGICLTVIISCMTQCLCVVVTMSNCWFFYCSFNCYCFHSSETDVIDDIFNWCGDLNLVALGILYIAYGELLIFLSFSTLTKMGLKIYSFKVTFAYSNLKKMSLIYCYYYCFCIIMKTFSYRFFTFPGICKRLS